MQLSLDEHERALVQRAIEQALCEPGAATGTRTATGWCGEDELRLKRVLSDMAAPALSPAATVIVHRVLERYLRELRAEAANVEDGGLLSATDRESLGTVLVRLRAQLSARSAPG
jgi:hypothetical protein